MVKELKSGNLSPDGSTPLWEYLIRGTVLLVCMNRTTAQTLQAADEAMAFKAKPHQRTAAQVVTQVCGTPQDTPQGLEQFEIHDECLHNSRANAFLKRLLYFKPWQLRETICIMRNNLGNFTLELCAQLTFYMIKNSRFFFMVAWRVEDIEQARQ